MKTSTLDYPLFRSTDPDTSRLAAESIAPKLPCLRDWTAECVRQTPHKTQRELGAIHCPEDLRKIGRRLNECVRLELVRLGVPRKCTVTGKMAQTYYVEGGR